MDVFNAITNFVSGLMASFVPDEARGPVTGMALFLAAWAAIKGSLWTGRALFSPAVLSEMGACLLAAIKDVRQPWFIHDDTEVRNASLAAFVDWKYPTFCVCNGAKMSDVLPRSELKRIQKAARATHARLALLAATRRKLAAFSAVRDGLAGRVPPVAAQNQTAPAS